MGPLFPDLCGGHRAVFALGGLDDLGGWRNFRLLVGVVDGVLCRIPWGDLGLSHRPLSGAGLGYGPIWRAA